MERRAERRLSGKVAIVSGAGTFGDSGVGNGAATAILFAREGAHVVLIDAVEDWAEATLARICAEGGEAVAAVADVTNPADCQRAAEIAVARYGGLHVLYNNVGGARVGGSVVETTDDGWQQAIALNVLSIVRMSRYAIPHLQAAGGGSIVNVSSVTALRPKTGRSLAAYTASKAAVVGLTTAMALDHARDNIRVNCIMPGLIWTPRVAAGRSGARDLRKASTPLPVEGEGWDVGWAAVYLASDEARFVTGIVLPVDGGFLLTSAPN